MHFLRFIAARQEDAGVDVKAMAMKWKKEELFSRLHRDHSYVLLFCANLTSGCAN